MVKSGSLMFREKTEFSPQVLPGRAVAFPRAMG